MAKEEAKPAPAESTEKKEAKGDGEEASGPKQIMGLSLPLFILVVLNLVTTAGGFGYIYYLKMIYKPPVITEVASKEAIKKDSENEEKAKIAGDGAVRILTLPEMSINLRSRVGGRNHYATITIALKCNNDPCMEEMKALRVKVEDTIQTIISSRSYAELSLSETSFRLKHEITKSINSFLKLGTVTDTYFSSYTVQ